MYGVLLAAIGTGVTFLLTTLGATVVFFFRKQGGADKLQKICLGFAAGVMIAASVWSLLIPAIERAEELGKIGWIPAAGGFALGVLFLLVLDKILPCFQVKINRGKSISEKLKRTILLVFAVTLHNIPEGMAVGLAFGLAAQDNNNVLLASAIALALGIGIQNIPEGAAIALPLREEGMSRTKAFLGGMLSGIVEPIFGILTVLIAGSVMPLMPWLLSFAAGAMLYVVVEELIPEAHLGDIPHLGTFGVMIGFMIMMILDVALG
ncbi:MAG: ZIP family metal transporter [Oscillospiraceae bacterium]